MRIRIHRGAHEIGGNCVEVEHDGQRIVLDVGRPLTSSWDDDVPLPDIAGLVDEDVSTLGVLISHHHADHWGLVDQVRAGLPIYLGAATQRILARRRSGPVACMRPSRLRWNIGKRSNSARSRSRRT